MSGLSVVVLSAAEILAAPAADRVSSLPGYGEPPTPHFSGFLNASAAEPGTFLHYWFAAASGDDWRARPVVLWLNGGPGASSLLGMIQEQGPLLIDKRGDLMQNPWAWTKLANLVAIESPAGVGYSYCKAMLSGGSCANTDDSTSLAAHAALVDFFRNKFPELRANSFFITGESYAGVYVPTLAARIVEANEAAASGSARINLVGLAVGDPCTDNDSQRDSMDMLWYAHKYGFVPEADFKLLWADAPLGCGLRHPSARTAGRWRAVAREGRLNGAELRAEIAQKKSAPRGAADGGGPKNCTELWRKYRIASSDGFSQGWSHAFINDLSLYGPAAGFVFDVKGSYNWKTAQWMQKARKALHMEDSPAQSWPGPASGWSYESSYAACNERATPGTPSMVDFYRKLAPKLAGKVIVFNGDTDPCVSYEGTRKAMRKVGFAELAGSALRPWFFDAGATQTELLLQKDLLFGPSLSAVDAGPQLGGEVVDFEHGLSFATVHGSGHMVPQFRPRAALTLLAHLLSNTSFSPPLPAELATLSEEEFEQAMATWVEQAKSPASHAADPHPRGFPVHAKTEQSQPSLDLHQTS